MLFLLRLLFLLQTSSVLALLLFIRLFRLFSLLLFSIPLPEDITAAFLSACLGRGMERGVKPG